MLPMRQNLESNEMGITYQDKIIDFGTVKIGSTTIKETLIKNERETSTDFTIKSYKSSNSLNQSFNIWPTKFTLGTGEFQKLTVSFTPARPYMVYIDYFYIFDSSGLHTSLTVKGETIGPYILPTKNEILIKTSQDEVQKESFYMKNFSEVPTMYQFEVDNENSVFRIHPRSSVIEGNGTVSITVEFYPINKGSFEKLIVCMIEHQCPILIRVIGLNGSFLGGVCPELLRCPVLSTNIFGYNDYQSYLCSDLDQVIDIKPKYSLKFMEGSIYERLAVTNLTHLPMTLVWGAESLRAFRVTPTWHALTPGVTVHFVVQYIWNKVNYRDCRKMCEDLREDGPDKELSHSIITSDLDGWIYWEKKGNCLNMPHDPWNFAQEYYDDKWESTKIPLNVTVKLIGQNLEKKRAFKVDCDVFPSTLVFPTSCDHQPVYTSLQIKNLTRTPVMYQLLPPENSDITAKPMEGVINEGLQIVILKLTPTIKGSSSYLENWVIRFNGSEYDQKSLILAGICESFGIRIGDNNQVTFSPSQLGCSTEEVVTIWNKSSYWIKLSCCSEKIPSILNIGAYECFLAPNELLEQQWIFHPTATGNYSVSIHYDAVIVQVPRIAALNKLAKQYFGGLIVQHDDIVIPTCKRSEPLKLPYPYPYSLIELDEFLSSHNRRSYEISVKMKCLDDTVMAQPKVMHLTDFIMPCPASSSFTLSNFGEACIPYSLVLLHEPDNIITTDPQDHRLENYARKEVDEYHYEIRPNKGMLWPKSSIRVSYTICSKNLKPQSYSVEMEIIQSNYEINSDSKKDILVKPRKVCFIHCDGKWPEVKITGLDSSNKDCIFNKFTLWKALNISGLNKVIKFNTPPKRTTFNLKFPERPLNSPPITYSFRLENFSPVPIEWEMLFVSNSSEEKAGFYPRRETAPKMFGSLRSILIRRKYPPSSYIKIMPTKGLIMPRAEEIIKMTVYFELEGSYTCKYRLSFKMMMLGIKEDIPEDSDGLSTLSFSECNVINSEEDGTKNDNPCNAYFTSISVKNSAMDSDERLNEESVTNQSNISQSKYIPNKTLILPVSKDDEDTFSRKYLSTNSNYTKPDVLHHSKLIFKPKMTQLTKPQIVLSRPWKALWVSLATANEELSQQESMAQECKQPKLKDGSPPELIERVSTTFKDSVVSLLDLLEKPEEPITYTQEQLEKFSNEILTSEFMDLIKKQQQELDTIEHSVSSSVKCKKILSTPFNSISNAYGYSPCVKEIRSKSEPCMSFLMTEQQYEDYDMLSENELYSVSLSNLPSLPEIKVGCFSEDDISEEEWSLKCQSLPCASVLKAADDLSLTKKMRSTSAPCMNILMTGEDRSVILDNNSSKSSNKPNLVTLNNLPSIPEIDEGSVSSKQETNASISQKPDMVSSSDSQTCYKSSVSSEKQSPSINADIVLFEKGVSQKKMPLKFQKSFPTSASTSKAGEHSLSIKKIRETSEPCLRFMTRRVHSMLEDDNTSSSSNEINLVTFNNLTSIPEIDEGSVSSKQETNISISHKPDMVSSSDSQTCYKSSVSSEKQSPSINADIVPFEKAVSQKKVPLKFQKSFPTSASMSKVGEQSLSIKKIRDTSEPCMRFTTRQAHSMFEDNNTSSSSNEPKLVKLNTRTSIPENDKDFVSSQQESNISISQKPDIVSSSVNQHHYKSTAQKSLGIREQQNKSDISLLGQKSSDAGKRISESRHISHNVIRADKPNIVSSSVNQHHYKSTAQKSLGIREQQNKSDISLLGQKSSDAGRRISESRHISHNIIRADGLPLRSSSKKSSPIINKQSSISSEKQSITKKNLSSIKGISQEHLKKYLVLPETGECISIDESISSSSDSDLDSNELFEAEKSQFRTLPLLCHSSSKSEIKKHLSGHRKSSTTTGCIKKSKETLPSIQESSFHKSSKNIPTKHQSYAQKIPKNLVISQNKLHYEDSLPFIKTDKGILPNKGKELFSPVPEGDKSGTLFLYKALKKENPSLITSLKSSKGKIVVVAKDSHSQRSAPDSRFTGSSSCKLQKKIKTSKPNYPRVPFESQRPFKCTDQSGSVVISHRCLDILGYGVPDVPDVDVKSITTNKIVSTKKPITKLLPQPTEIIKIPPYSKSSNKKDKTVSKDSISSKNTVRVRFAEDVKSASVTNSPRINKRSVGIKSSVSCKSAKSAIATNTSTKSTKGSEDTNVMIISPRSKGSKDILGTKRSKETKNNEGIEEPRGLKGKKNIKDTKPNVTTKGKNCKKDLKGSKGRKNKKGAKNNKEIKDTKEMKAEKSIAKEDTKFKCIMGCEGVKDIKDIVGIKDNKYIRGASVIKAMRGIKLIEETKDVAGIKSMKTTTAAGSTEGINSIRESICKNDGEKSLHSKKIACTPESGSRTDVREEVRHREYANVAIIEEFFDSDSVSESNSSVTLEGKIKIQSSVESEEEDNGKSISESLEEIELSSIIAPTEKVSSRELGEIKPKPSVATKIIDRGFVSESSEEIELSSTIASTEKLASHELGEIKPKPSVATKIIDRGFVSESSEEIELNSIIAPTEKLSSHKLGEIMPKSSVATKIKSTEVCPGKKQRRLSVDDSKRKDLILVTPENTRRAFSLPTGEKPSPSSCQVSECNLKREVSMLSIPVLKEQPSYSNVSLPLLELYKALEGKNIEECLKMLRQMQNSVEGEHIYYVTEVQFLSDDSCTSTNLSPSSDSETIVPNLLESQEISTSSANNKNMEQSKAGSRDVFSTSTPFKSKSHSERSKIDPKEVKKYNHESLRPRLKKSTISEVGSKKDKIKAVDKMKTSLSKTKTQSLEDYVNSDGSCCIGPFASLEAGNNDYTDESENFEQDEKLTSKNYSLSNASSDLFDEHNSDEYGNSGKESSVSELDYNSFQKPRKNKIISSFMRLIQPNHPVEFRKKKLWHEPKDPIAVNVDLEITVTANDDCRETASIFPRLHSNNIKMMDVCVGKFYSPLQVVWLFNPHHWKRSKYVIENFVHIEMSQREENGVFECLNPRGVIKPHCLHPLFFRFDPTESRLYKTTMLIGFKELKKQICIEGRGVEHVPQTLKTIQPSYPVHNIKEKPDFPVNLSDEVLVISKPIPGHCKAMRLIYLVNSSERTMRFNWKIMAQHDFLNNLVDVNVQPSHGTLLPSQILPFIVSFSKATKKKQFHISEGCPHAKDQTSEFNSLNIHADNQPVNFSNTKKNSPMRSTNEKLERKVNISFSSQTKESSETSSDEDVSLDSLFQCLEHEVAMMNLFVQDEENEEIDDDCFNTGSTDFDNHKPKKKDNDCWKSPERAYYDQEGRLMTMYALSVPEVEKRVTGTLEDKPSKMLRRALAKSGTLEDKPSKMLRRALAKSGNTYRNRKGELRRRFKVIRIGNRYAFKEEELIKHFERMERGETSLSCNEGERTDNSMATDTREETSLSSDEEVRTDNTMTSEPRKAISTPIIRKINSSPKNTERHNKNGKNVCLAYGFDITGKRQPGKRGKGICFAEVIDAIDKSSNKSGKRVCFVHKLAIDSKESSKNSVKNVEFAPDSDISSIESLRKRIKIIQLEPEYDNALMESSKKSGKIVQFIPEVKDTLESPVKGEKEVRFVPKIDTSLETLKKSRKKVHFDTEVENSFSSSKKCGKHVHFAKEIEYSLDSPKKSMKKVHFSPEVETLELAKNSKKKVHFAKEIENSFVSSNKSMKKVHFSPDVETLELSKKSKKKVHFGPDVENSFASIKKSGKHVHFAKDVENSFSSSKKSGKHVHFATEIENSLDSSKKGMKKVHFSPEVETLELAKKSKKKIHFGTDVENSCSSSKKSGKHVHFAAEIENSLDSSKKGMKKVHFSPEVETLELAKKSKKNVHFETEIGDSLKSSIKSMKKVHFAPDVEDALESSKKDRKKVHFAKEIEDSVESSQMSRKGFRFSSVNAIDYLGSSDEVESDIDEKLWDLKSCQCNDSSLLVDWFPLTCELTETKVSSSYFMEKEEKVCKPFNISVSMYNEEELEVPYKERLTWPPNDELLCLNTEQIPKFDDLPILHGRNVEWIIQDILEVILWNLLHSEWFRVMHTKMSMEHTVKDWRRQKINAELQDPIHPSPNDEVPFYSQIVTADKPLFNQIHHAGEETCTLDTKPSTSKGPTKKPSSQLDSVHVCKEKDILDFKLQENVYVCDDNMEMNSEERPNKILPYAIPRIVVSTIFEDIISELTLSTLTDFFEPAYDIKKPFQDYDNKNDSQFND